MYLRFSHPNEVFEAIQHNKVDTNELHDSDEDFDDEQKEEGMDFMAQMLLRQNQQFDTNIRMKQEQKEQKSVQRTLSRIHSLRFVNRHLCYRKSYVLRIHLTGINPQIWREIRVPSRLSLSVLHDKVLTPLFDWKRNFHAFQFTVPHRGNKFVSFGPTRSTAVDMMWIGWCSRMREAGAHMIESSKVYLSDVLYLKGSTLRYVYDLGDRFHHTIELKEILIHHHHHHHPGDEEEIEIIGGQRGGPPENSNGNQQYAETLNQLRESRDFKKYNELLCEPNIHGRFWHPEQFDVERCRRRMKKYFRKMLTTMNAPSMQNRGNIFGIDFGMKKDGMKKKHPLPPTWNVVQRECFNEECEFENRKEEKREMRGCGGCKSAFYCSRRCQKIHWNKEHRYYCFNYRRLRIRVRQNR